MQVYDHVVKIRQNKAITNSIWNMLSTVLLRGGVFLSNIIIAQILGVEMYGKYAYIKNTSQVFEFSLGIAFGISMTKFVAGGIHRSDKTDLYGIIKSNLVTSILLSFFIFIILEIFAYLFLSENINSTNDLILLRVSFLYLIFINISHSFVGILKGLEKFKLYFQVSLFVGTTNLLFALIFTYFFSLVGAVITLTLLAFIQLVILTIVVEKHIPVFKYILSKKVIYNHSIQKSFNIPALLSGLTAPPILWLISYLLIKLPNGLTEVALYNVGFLIFALLVFAPMAISDSLFPSINKLVENKVEFIKTIKKHIVILFAISFIVAIPTFLFPSQILSVFGKEFSGGTTILRWFSIAAILSSLLVYLGKVLAALHLMWSNLMFNFIWAILVLIIGIIDLNGGAEWIAKSFVFSYAGLFVIQSGYIWYKLRINENSIQRGYIV
jgi:O-antigen/teichoic acid export membrane protein